MLGRRTFIMSSVVTSSGALAASDDEAHAQLPLPDKPIRLLVGFGSGNGTDIVARQLAPQLERRIGRRVSVENRIGVSGATAGEGLKNGPNDGTFLALLPSTTIASKLGDPDYPFDPLKDTAPITLLGRCPLAIAVSPRIDVTSCEEYIKWLGAGGADRAVLGSTAASNAFVGAYGKMMSQAFHVPMKIRGYRGGTDMARGVSDGEVPACVSNLPTLLPAHRGGKLRIIMVTGSRRSSALPKIPTTKELGIEGLDVREWYMLFTGGRAPVAAVDAWNEQMRLLLAQDDFKGLLTGLGLEVESTTPAETRQIVTDTLDEWRIRMEGYGVLSKR
jgi:tripartite-type tricarboxylate transporter receptor subunit TctC